MIRFGNLLNILGFICEGIGLVFIYRQLPEVDEKISDDMLKYRLEDNPYLALAACAFADKDAGDVQKWITLLFGFGIFCQILGTKIP